MIIMLFDGFSFVLAFAACGLFNFCQCVRPRSRSGKYWEEDDDLERIEEGLAHNNTN